MPDWFYRTVSRPLLFRLPAAQAQGFACGFMGTIGNLPCGLGGRIIDFLGHMRPDARLSRKLHGKDFIGPVGLGTRLDGVGLATNAWKRFGFSFIELGPVTTATQSARQLERDVAAESLIFETQASISPTELAEHLQQSNRDEVHLIVRLQAAQNVSPKETAEDLLRLITPLREHIDTFSIDVGSNGALPSWSKAEWQIFWDTLRSTQPDVHWLLVIPATSSFEFTADCLVGCAGVIVDAFTSENGRFVFCPKSKASLIAAVRSIREEAKAETLIIASGGIHQPIDAAEVLEAGASLVQIDTGMIYSGPGLPKRINEAWLSTMPETEPAEPMRMARLSWFWTSLMGVGMLIGSLLALWIALTHVVFPYDEVFCGINRAQLQAINERLLPFMSHDRVSLAGTMIAIGLLYVCCSWFGSRRGEHWAKVAVLASGGAGFCSFFLFLGFDYFDPFHGFVTAILFQLFVQGIVGDLPARKPSLAIDWTESPAWRRAQWGQFLLVLHSAGLLGAGVIICFVGINDVFVQTDLNFLQTEFLTLRNANERLIPLVAHDRATLGGMLIASGILYLLASMWGLRRGASWLWHAFLWSALAAYACAIGVHFWVGYVDWHHLLPAFAGLTLLLAGLALSREWLMAAPASRSAFK